MPADQQQTGDRRTEGDAEVRGDPNGRVGRFVALGRDEVGDHRLVGTLADRAEGSAQRHERDREDDVMRRRRCSRGSPRTGGSSRGGSRAGDRRGRRRARPSSRRSRRQRRRSGSRRRALSRSRRRAGAPRSRRRSTRPRTRPTRPATRRAPAATRDRPRRPRRGERAWQRDPQPQAIHALLVRRARHRWLCARFVNIGRSPPCAPAGHLRCLCLDLKAFRSSSIDGDCQWVNSADGNTGDITG